MVRLWLINLMPFLARWQDTAPPLWDAGPASRHSHGLSLEMVGALKPGEAPDATHPGSAILSEVLESRST